MTLDEITERFPALLDLHGGTLQAFQSGLRRTASTNPARRSERSIGCGSGNRVAYQLWQVRVFALRLILNRLAPSAKLDEHALTETLWANGRAVVQLDDGHHCRATLDITIPPAIWAELDTAGDATTLRRPYEVDVPIRIAHTCGYR